MSDAPEAGTSTVGGRRRWPLYVAIAAQVGLGVFPYSASGLLAPPAGVVAAGLLWLVLTLTLLPMRRRGLLVLLVPVVTAAAWFALMTVGDFLFGWTA